MRSNCIIRIILISCGNCDPYCGAIAMYWIAWAEPALASTCAGSRCAHTGVGFDGIDVLLFLQQQFFHLFISILFGNHFAWWATIKVVPLALTIRRAAGTTRTLEIISKFIHPVIFHWFLQFQWPVQLPAQFDVLNKTHKTSNTPHLS